MADQVNLNAEKRDGIPRDAGCARDAAPLAAALAAQPGRHRHTFTRFGRRRPRPARPPRARHHVAAGLKAPGHVAAG